MSFDPEKITLFAETDARGKRVPFGIKAKDRQRHVYVIGKTGMGKSTMLENMAVQDIQSGEGVAFIDPHGSTAEALLDFVPEHRVNDVLYFAPHDMDYPVSFNIMEDVGPDKRHLVVSGLMSVFEKIWVDAWSARMAYILQNTLMALLEYPDSTLLGVNTMLSNEGYRNKVIANVKDPGVKSFWVDEFLKYNERYMQEAGDAIKNKIGQFTANPVIRNIIGQPKSSFDIRTMMDEKKILIMNLSKGLIGETNANLLGSMLTTRIYLAAMSRADLPQHEMQTMPNFYFYVDEFQSFANSTFSNILSEARKYKLNLTIAHQYIEQMEEEVKNAVFGNVGTVISFRVGPFDAEVLETIFAPQFNATDIVNLGFAQVYLTLMIDGIGSPPFSAVTLPPIQAPSVSCRDMVIAASRKQYAYDRTEVERAVITFHERAEQDQKDLQASKKQNKGQKKPNNQNSQQQGQPHSDQAHSPIVQPHTERESNNRNRQDRSVQSNQRNERLKPKGKSLNELRDVLRKVSATEKAAREERAPSSRKDAAQKSARRESETLQQSELKEALSEVLHGTSEPLRKEQTPQAQGGVEAEYVPSEVEGTSSDTTVSPKELERMMRVNTSDKPPIK